ncbi:protein NRT1/ PTR FAMILY 2.6-like [Senna tora]|uniref:Protein NRT1/ PTR FAMILY 2.6-like n=1 Tax=Senna tora TaxID=362788 RepID=A0A834TJW8_9FABA|nr:protein NRT1/ PTR FAMILY 2.6-like [Senna tora]
MNSITATQISNVAYGFLCFIPIVGAILADSFFGSFNVVLLSSCVSLLDNVSWGLGFGISAVANLMALAILLVGFGFYRRLDVPRGGRSPFLELARVPIAALRKWWTSHYSHVSCGIGDYYYGGRHCLHAVIPEKRLRFFNRAALITEGDLAPDGTIAKSWRICTVQQLQDFKALIGVLSIWSSCILLSTPIAIQNNLTILQALTMDRHLGPHFKIPSSSMVVVVQISAAIFLILIDGVLVPAWRKLIGGSLTPLRRVGAGHVFVALAMMISALIESKRLHQLEREEVGMSALWLFPQLVMVGIGEALYFPGLTAFYYKKLPESLKSISAAMISMDIGIAYFLSTVIIDFVRKVTDWLPDDLNHGGLNYVYWMLVLLGVINFGYFLLCSMLYKKIPTL